MNPPKVRMTSEGLRKHVLQGNHQQDADIAELLHNIRNPVFQKLHLFKVRMLLHPLYKGLLQLAQNTDCG